MGQVWCVAGLGFGDEGKGTTVDYLVRRHGAKLVVRYNGGAQAGHNVVTPDGRHHCFSQWGSGTLAGAKTFLSRFMMVNPIYALSEAKHLEGVGIKDPLTLLTAEEKALVTTPFHVAANRLEEMARGDGRHGSCGLGIGQTMEDALNDKEGDTVTVGDLIIPSRLRKKLISIQHRKWSWFEARFERHVAKEMGGDWGINREILRDAAVIDTVVDAYALFAHKVKIVGDGGLQEAVEGPDAVIFEGAQGVLLDQDWGFHPHTTWSDCTFGNAKKILGNIPFCRLGVLRTFHTRHGAGPFPTEDPKIHSWFTEHDHNVHTPWQHGLRVGAFDLVLARYALDVVGGVDGLVITHADKPLGKICVAYEPTHQFLLRKQPNDLHYQEELGQMLKRARPVYKGIEVKDGGTSHAKHFAELLKTPLALVSTGPTAKKKIEL